MATINSVSLGVVKVEDHSKNANLDENPMPLTDSNNAQAWDFNGVLREIRLEGIFAADNIANLRTFVSNMEALINGNQTSPYDYASDFTGTIFKVKVRSFRWIYSEASPLAIDYNIEFVEAEF